MTREEAAKIITAQCGALHEALGIGKGELAYTIIVDFSPDTGIVDAGKRGVVVANVSTPLAAKMSLDAMTVLMGSLGIEIGLLDLSETLSDMAEKNGRRVGGRTTPSRRPQSRQRRRK